jgi:tetratricopeptide (TPR) repeat protein
MFVLGVLGARVGADEPRADAEARRLYNEGVTAYKAGRYDEAIARYSAAHDLVPRPFFLFNIAQAYRLGGHKEQALVYYKAFLAASPDAFNAAEVREHIRDLEQELAQPAPPPPERVAAPLAPPPPPSAPVAPPEPEPAPIYKRWWFWAGVGGALAATAVAIVVVGSGGGGPPGTDLGTTKIFP